MTTEYLRKLEEKVASGNAAVIVVDVQNDFCADDGVFGRTDNDLSMVRGMIPNLQRLNAGARKVGVPVIFIQAIYVPVYLPPVWYERNARINFEIPRCVTGTSGGDFYEVAPLQGETIVRKHRHSAFVDTERCRRRIRRLEMAAVLEGGVSLGRALKVNIGLSLIGAIVGEFLAANAGQGYLIIYGQNMFNMSLVMMSLVILTGI